MLSQRVRLSLLVLFPVREMRYRYTNVLFVSKPIFRYHVLARKFVTVSEVYVPFCAHCIFLVLHLLHLWVAVV